MFDAEQPEALQGQRLQAVARHAELLHGGQPLQDLRHVAELVEGQPQVAQPLQGAQLAGQGVQAVTVQQERLQTGQDKRGRGFFFCWGVFTFALFWFDLLCSCVVLLPIIVCL